MKKQLLIFIFGLSLALTIQSIAEAQMINYQRRNKNPNNAPVKVQPTVAPQSKKIVQPKKVEESFNQKMARLMKSEPLVTNRTERMYDFDRDGKLQKQEFADFLKDVASSVERRGSFDINSEVLKSFDKDRDGKISRYEIKEVAQYIE